MHHLLEAVEGRAQLNSQFDFKISSSKGGRSEEQGVVVCSKPGFLSFNQEMVTGRTCTSWRAKKAFCMYNGSETREEVVEKRNQRTMTRL